MKKLIELSLILPFLSLMALTSCKKDSIASKSDGVENKSNASNVKNVDAGQWQFAQTLNKALVLPEVRAFLKSEALKKFDADFDILYKNVRNAKLSTGKIFEETLLSFGALPKINSTTNAVDGTVNELLNIYIFAPNDNCKDWETATSIPKVAVEPNVDLEKQDVPIPALDKDGNVSYFESKTDPNEIVIVVGYNERVKPDGQVKEFSTLKQVDKKPLETRGAFRVVGGVENLWQINIPNLSAIESWIKGSPELRFVTVAQQVGQITDTPIWGEDRSNFTSSNWFQANRNVLGGWFTSIQGNFMRYHWYEEDSGFGTNITRNFSFTNLNGITTTYSIRNWSLDDELNFDTVFFSDLTWKAYMASNGVGAVRWYTGPF